MASPSLPKVNLLQMYSESNHIEAQQALDELRKEELLPFSMVAHKVTDNGLGDYMVHFYDSRLHSVVVGWHEGESFKATVRAAVLLQIDRWLAEKVSLPLRIRQSSVSREADFEGINANGS